MAAKGKACLEWLCRLLCSPSHFLCVSTTATHSQIMLLHSLKKANYQLPLLITDSGEPPLSNSTEVKVQVCVCKKNKMHCSSASSLRGGLLTLLASVLLPLLSKCLLTDKHRPWDHAMFCLLLLLKMKSISFTSVLRKLLHFTSVDFVLLPSLGHSLGSQTWIYSEYLIQVISTGINNSASLQHKRIPPTTTLAKWGGGALASVECSTYLTC